MNIEEKIVAAIRPVTANIFPQEYSGTSLEYCTYNYDSLPRLFADGRARRYVHLIQLHYCCPAETNSFEMRRKLLKAIVDAGFSSPEITDASDDAGQHWVFEFEGKDNGEFQM